MGGIAAPLERLIEALSRLPGVGRKTAQRLAFHVVGAPASEAVELAEALATLHESIRPCSICFNLAEAERCAVCEDPRRDPSLLCVVERATDLLPMERTGYRGLYHVLGGALSPLGEIGPDDLHLGPLVERVREGAFNEVILANNPTVEGEATAHYVARLLAPLEVRVTRIAQGLPVGSDLEYTDEATLSRALAGRREISS